MTTSVKTKFMPPSLISNLQQVLSARTTDAAADATKSPPSEDHRAVAAARAQKAVILVTNADGIEAPGLALLVGALARDSRFDVCVCAPQLDKSMSGHAVTVGETISVCSADINGALAFEVSGSAVDCVSLALSGALFSWAKPALVISGINRGSNSGHNMVYSGAVAAAREAVICGVPSSCISLNNCNNNTSCERNMKEALGVCLPLIHAALKGVETGVFPQTCFLNVEIPSSPSKNKGFKLTRPSLWRSSLNWHPVLANKHSFASTHFMSNQQSLGIMLAQLGRDASAAGAARRSNSHRKNIEIESVGVAGKLSSHQTVKRYFRLELLDKDVANNVDEDLDIGAVDDGFVSITPLSISPTLQCEVQKSVSNWFANSLSIKN